MFITPNIRVQVDVDRRPASMWPGESVDVRPVVLEGLLERGSGRTRTHTSRQHLTTGEDVASTHTMYYVVDDAGGNPLAPGVYLTALEEWSGGVWRALDPPHRYLVQAVWQDVGSGYVTATLVRH